MPYFVDNEKHWRERAREARAIAETLEDPVIRDKMFAIADAYERMAQRAGEPKAARDALNRNLRFNPYGAGARRG